MNREYTIAYARPICALLQLVSAFESVRLADTVCDELISSYILIMFECLQLVRTSNKPAVAGASASHISVVKE